MILFYLFHAALFVYSILGILMARVSILSGDDSINVAGYLLLIALMLSVFRFTLGMLLIKLTVYFGLLDVYYSIINRSFSVDLFVFLVVNLLILFLYRKSGNWYFLYGPFGVFSKDRMPLYRRLRKHNVIAKKLIKECIKTNMNQGLTENEVIHSLWLKYYIEITIGQTDSLTKDNIVRHNEEIQNKLSDSSISLFDIYNAMVSIELGLDEESDCLKILKKYANAMFDFSYLYEVYNVLSFDTLMEGQEEPQHE